MYLPRRVYDPTVPYLTLWAALPCLPACLPCSARRHPSGRVRHRRRQLVAPHLPQVTAWHGMACWGCWACCARRVAAPPGCLLLRLPAAGSGAPYLALLACPSGCLPGACCLPQTLPTCSPSPPMQQAGPSVEAAHVPSRCLLPGNTLLCSASVLLPPRRGHVLPWPGAALLVAAPAGPALFVALHGCRLPLRARLAAGLHAPRPSAG